MPSSRGRKSQRRAKIAARARHHRERATRPSWYDESIRQVLRHRRTLLFAKRPRELEQATCELLGAQLHSAVRSRAAHLNFDRWFGELASATLSSANAPVSQDESDIPGWWLLHGLLAIAPTDFLIPAIQDLLDATTGHCDPAWLPLACRVQATGEIWHLTNRDETRIALVAGYEYPGGADQHVYLFDVETCSPVELLGADVFDTLDQAARAWRASVGESAVDSHPSAVTDHETLMFLPYCCDPAHISGLESRNRLDNWFRAARRVEELLVTLRRRGTPVPPIPIPEFTECR
ncbi:hypothetical protein [Nocardia acidivorans]|uniref:hypothetical protein n=1 Tax=Nocardia acidivorans TaxID=404580 RepID=UPI0012FBFAF1|nr:hypothetical protein [Nocardia acidivorans]